MKPSVRIAKNAETTRICRISRSAARSVPAAPAAPSLSAHASLGVDGRLQIPAALRDAAGIKRGDKLFLRVEGEQIVVESFHATIKRLQDLLAPLKRPGVSIVDELIADRRAESRREADRALAPCAAECRSRPQTASQIPDKCPTFG